MGAARCVARSSRFCRRYCAPMSAQVFIKLFAIFAVVAIGWGAAKQRPARQRRPGAGARRRRVLRLRAGAAVSHLGADRVRAARRPHPPRLLRADARGARPGLPVPAPRGRPAAASAAAPSVRAITASFGNAVQVGIPLAAALYGEAGLALHITLVSLHALILLTVLTALVELDLARAERRAAAGGPRLLRTLATTVRNTVVHPVILPVLAGLAWNASGLAIPGFADEILADPRPGGRAALPGADRRLAGALRREGRGARRGRPVAGEAGRASRSRCSSSPASSSA